jgi:hypothetical protein
MKILEWQCLSSRLDRLCLRRLKPADLVTTALHSARAVCRERLTDR